SSVYVIHKDLPEYSIMLHFYLSIQNRDVEKVTFSILKIVEDKRRNLQVYPINLLLSEIKDEIDKEVLKKDATTIYNRFTNNCKVTIDIKKEYHLYNSK